MNEKRDEIYGLIDWYIYVYVCSWYSSVGALGRESLSVRDKRDLCEIMRTGDKRSCHFYNLHVPPGTVLYTVTMMS